ncbi:MAG TPA: alpha/beta hydrolase [Allosphingosinicella sp.]|nr:alpha/beta hydrolase [Allosphingosinicella sp.]
MGPLAILGGGAALLGGGLAVFSGLTARRIEAAVPKDGEVIEAEGHRLHIAQAGDGPPILLIHGLAGQMRNFHRDMVDDLVRDYRVIRVDRPGSGYSPRGADASARLPAQAEAMAALIRTLGLKTPLVVGHSLGGALALTLALDHPELVGGLALIAPLSQAQDIADVPPVFHPLIIRSPALRRAVAWTLATPAGMVRAHKALTEIFAPEPVPADFGTAGGGLLAMRPGGFHASSSDLVALEGDLGPMAARLGSLDLPVAILYGRDDNLLDYRLHGETSAGQIKSGRIELVDGGHMLPFTQPVRSARFVRDAAERLWPK